MELRGTLQSYFKYALYGIWYKHDLHDILDSSDEWMESYGNYTRLRTSFKVLIFIALKLHTKSSLRKTRDTSYADDDEDSIWVSNIC